MPRGRCSALVPGLLVPAIALAQNGPACAPATLNNSALLDGAVTVSPLPGSRDASPQTQISFIGVPTGELSVVSVVGSVTGEHSGRLAAYSQGDGASFLPGRPFAEGERVTVRALCAAAGPRGSAGHVRVAIGHDQLHSRADPSRAAAEVQSFHSRPDLHPPVVTVTAPSAEASADDMFVAPYTGPGQAGPMIIDQNGSWCGSSRSAQDLGDQPAGPAIPGQTRADVVAGGHLGRMASASATT